MTQFRDRRDYNLSLLDETSVNPSPFAQLELWLQEATESDAIDEPYAMTIATVNSSGQPSARVVLLRQLAKTGLTFFTNYNSRKGVELQNNPAISAVFYWGPLERQVRVEGAVEIVSAQESDEYFSSRPHLSKLGALASAQSSVIPNREYLEEHMRELIEQYPESTEVPRPQWWGGFCIVPTQFEFWQGRRSRLHDRIRYQLSSNTWQIDRLSP